MAAPMNSKKHAHQFTVDFVNSNFSNDIKRLTAVRSIYEEQKKRQQSLQQKVSLYVFSFYRFSDNIEIRIESFL